MNGIHLLDKVRFVPVLNLATLWWFGVSSLRYPGWISRAVKMFFTIVGCTILSGMVCAVFAWAPEWGMGLCVFCCLYGITVATIYSVRDEMLNISTKQHPC